MGIQQGEKTESSLLEPADEIEIFSLGDTRLKVLMEELLNETSRSILNAIFEGRQTAGEIASYLNLSVSLVVYHLDRFVQTGIIKISGTEVNSKNRKMKLYDSKKKAIIIKLNQNDEDRSKIKKSFILSTSIAVISVISMIIQLFDFQNQIQLAIVDTDTITTPISKYFLVILSGIVATIATGIAIWLKKK